MKGIPENTDESRGRVSSERPATGGAADGGTAGNGVPEGRVARRRARVRARIVEVTEQLIGDCDIDEVTIDDIAEGADIARRSFYHHFESKHDVLVPIARSRTRVLNRRIDALVGTIEDPAEGMGTAMRFGFRGIIADPLCRWFVLRSGLPHERLYEGLGESGMRDAIRAHEAGRFHVNNPEIVRLITSGAFISVLGARAEDQIDDGDLDDAVEHLLRMFGLDAEEARDIAHRPLPPLPRDPGEN